MTPTFVALAVVAALAGAPYVKKGIERFREPPAQASLTRPRPLPSSAPFGQDARDMRSIDGMTDHPGYAITPQGVLAAFREAESGQPQKQCDLFDDLIENDAHLRNLFEQREQAVSGKPWVIQGQGEDGDSELAARVLTEALGRLPMIEVFQHLLTANRNGWGCAEIDWGLMTFEGAVFIVPTWLTPVPARRFRITTGFGNSSGGIDELRLLTDLKRPEGDELRPAKWIVLRRSGTRIARAALMRTGAWPAMAKRLGFRDALIFSQRFGLPLPIVHYDESADESTKDVGVELIKKLGSDGGAVVPKGLRMELVSGVQGDNQKVHSGLIAHCNAEMSKLVNGSTLSNDNANSGGGASYGLGEVHDTVRWDNVLFDAERLQEAFGTQLFVPFMHFNNLKGARPLLKLQVVRELDPKTLVEIAAILKNELGIEVSIKQLRQLLGVREPAGTNDAAPGAPKPSVGAAA